MAENNDKQAENKAMDDALVERMKKKRKENRKRGVEKESLGMNSLMDMITIILIFLVKSYGEDPLVVLPNTDLPISTADINPKEMTVVTVNKEGIFLVRERILDLEEGRVSGNYKKGGEAGLIIEPLEAALRTEVEKLRTIAMSSGKPFEGDLIIIADQAVNYRLLVEVMQTAIGTEFKKFRFAVIQGSMKQSGRYSGAPELPN
jgi:biopolymer transport protein ExbD